MHTIAFVDLLWLLPPLGIVYVIYYRWCNDKVVIVYALSRMVLQLILIGYCLVFLFSSNHFALIMLVLSIMLLSASFIALRPLAKKSSALYFKSFLSVSAGSFVALVFVIFGVLRLEVWYEPRFLIPIAGMIFSNSMNSVSVAAERFEMERERSMEYVMARNTAFKASLIPNINSLFAVGLVSIPGMMAGQVLSGADPIEAVKYQIMVMAMIILSGGIATAVYLRLRIMD